MKCRNCKSKTKVTDSRGKSSPKARLWVLKKISSINGNEDIDFRWRQRICLSCRKMSYTIECDLEDFKALIQEEASNEKSKKNDTE
jgi:hypothetical protein